MPDIKIVCLFLWEPRMWEVFEVVTHMRSFDWIINILITKFFEQISIVCIVQAVNSNTIIWKIDVWRTNHFFSNLNFSMDISTIHFTNRFWIFLFGNEESKNSFFGWNTDHFYINKVLKSSCNWNFWPSNTNEKCQSDNEHINN